MAKKKNKHREIIQKELDDLNQSAGILMAQSMCESSYRLYGELRNRAKSENSLVHYVFGTFFQMNLAHRQFQFETVRERAVELIAIFEIEELARKIEPELNLEEYEGLRYGMGACAYEVLAEATAELEGYNSQGMQECLAGGIDICHRLGKLACVGCFREYACDVHRAADDFEMARFHCKQVLEQTEDFVERGDRRWLAMMKLANMDLYEGQHDLARERLESAWEYAQFKTVNDRFTAMFCVGIQIHNLDVIEGRQIDERVLAHLKELPPRGECVEFDFDVDCATSLQLAQSKNWDKAEKILTKWHRFMKQQKATSLWIETGIRIAACKRLRGDMESAKRIASPLEMAATSSNDWLSLKRLNQVLDTSVDITPLGTVVRTTQVQRVDAARSKDPVNQPQRPIYHELSKDTPLFQWLENLSGRLKEAHESESVEIDLDAFRSELMLSQNRDWSHPEDIGRAIHFMVYLISPGTDYRAVWEWANKLVAGFQETGYLLSILARLGMSLVAAERFEQLTQIDLEAFDGELPPPVIESERLEQLVRKSLQIDAWGVNNNFRAGEVFEFIDNLGESERCYARAFKLDRTRVDAALALARIYSNSDRVSDAHYVLDLCIREGGDSPELYFEAAMRAHILSMHELQVNYLKTLLEKYPPIPWVFYYLAIGLLELKRPQEAFEMIQREIAEFEGKGIHIQSILAEAHALLGKFDHARKAIESALEQWLVDMDELTRGGFVSGMERLWRASKLVGDRALQTKVEQRLLESGTAPELYFEELRANRRPKDVNLYQITIVQPLKDDWSEFRGCLPGQDEWTTYLATWGVLAENEEEAKQMALEMQRRCYDLEPEIVAVQESEEPLHDRPGVVFQGLRGSNGDNPFDDDEFLDDEEDDDDKPF